MSDSSPAQFSETFEHQVRECLAHFYDFAQLQNDPIAYQLVPHLSGTPRVQAVRQILSEDIDKLNRNKEDTPISRQGRAHNILYLRYIEDQSPQDVMQQIAVSERQFYREHRRAIQALSSLLWERIVQSPNRPTASEPMSLETEVQRVYAQSDELTVRADDLLDGVIDALRALAEQRHLQLIVRDCGDLTLHTHRVMLRQLLIWIVTDLIKGVRSEGVLHLSCQFQSAHVVIKLTLRSNETDVALLRDTIAQQDAVRAFAQALGAALSINVGNSDEMSVAVELHQRKPLILVIDDNPDVIALLQRHMFGQPYEVIAAAGWENGLEIARNSQPCLIILDVMLPNKDGWEILQYLKNNPITQNIPVYICSVLDSQELSSSLGADGFLRKPPSQAEFLKVLESCKD